MSRVPSVLIISWLAFASSTFSSLQAANPERQSATPPSPSVSEQRAVLDKYCVTCHNEKAHTAGLMLDKMNLASVSESADVWEKVVRKLRGGSMPPVGRPRPDKAAYDTLASWLETTLDAAATAKPNPGVIPALHRLNRAEYANAIRDLLALDIDVTALLPPDDASFGFDNIADGRISTTLLERYIAAARKISRVAVGNPHVPVDVRLYPIAPDLAQGDRLDDLPFGTRGGTLIRYQFPVDADYVIKIRFLEDRVLFAGSGNAVEDDKRTVPHQIEISIDGERVQLLTVQAENADRSLEVRVPVKAGLRAVGVTFLKRPSVEGEDLRLPFQRAFRLTTETLSLDGVEISGPYNVQGAGDSLNRRRIFVCRPARSADEARCAKQILSTLARRAYRRPVTDQDLQDLLPFYDAGRTEGGFEAGVEMALRRMLASPSFLFRIERDPGNVAPETAYRLSDVGLASRLSFFLWSSIPDDELLDVAARGRLKDPAVLERQVRRMLADPRSQALVTNFAGQWLYLRNVVAAKADPRLFPDFNENLRTALRRETELFIDSIVHEDRSAIELLTANYTFVNERLARHYGIPNVYGDHFRRVTLSDDSVRGGLLSQGSILTVTSYANRTSPVRRGKWILENILGAPPPPPPPDVPDLQDTNREGKVLSMRERMAQHRANPVCASCHVNMDALGLPLENFDAVGRWRTRSESNEPIDASGALPDNTKFDGVAGLKKALASHPEQFVTTLTEKLLTYALGRGIEYYDAPAVRQITHTAARNDYRFSSLIMGIVKSTPFQMRRSVERPSADSSVASVR